MEHVTWDEAMRRGRAAMEDWLRKETTLVLDPELHMAEAQKGEEKNG